MTSVRSQKRAMARAILLVPMMMQFKNIWGTTPLPEPLSLEEAIKHFARWIFAGRLHRTVYLSPQTLKKMFTDKAEMKPEDLKLYERHEMSHINSGFLEIKDSQPIFRRADIPADEVSGVTSGTVYCYIGTLGTESMDSYIDPLVGKQCLFFFSGEVKKFGNSDTLFPRPLYGLSGGRSWRDSLPLPIEELPRVAAIANRLNFVDLRQGKR